MTTREKRSRWSCTCGTRGSIDTKFSGEFDESETFGREDQRQFEGSGERRVLMESGDTDREGSVAFKSPHNAQKSIAVFEGGAWEALASLTGFFECTRGVIFAGFASFCFEKAPVIGTTASLPADICGGAIYWRTDAFPVGTEVVDGAERTVGARTLQENSLTPAFGAADSH